jgi:hypothetical protein
VSARHTPGPWAYSTDPQPNGCPIVGARGLIVAMLAHSVNHSDQAEIATANARLIAAAPDLLRALVALDACYCEAGDSLSKAQRTHHRETLMAARAAIARATGEQA